MESTSCSCLLLPLALVDRLLLGRPSASPRDAKEKKAEPLNIEFQSLGAAYKEDGDIRSEK